MDGLAMPTAGLVGRRLVFRVAPHDVWSSVRSVRWSFGDGTVGTGDVTGHLYGRTGRYTVQVTASDVFGHATVVRRSVAIG